MTEMDDAVSAMLAALASFPASDDPDTLYHELMDSGIATNHCRRHYYIPFVPKNRRNAVNHAIIYYNGSKSAWWTKDGGVEFYNNTKVYPQGTKPWDWCGTTLLFQDWQDRVELAHTFRIGASVSFIYDNVNHVGLVSHIGDRLTVITPEGKFYMQASSVRRW
jgi:hypothetical protein